MLLEVGSRLGHYDVTTFLGGGVGGQVRQAADTPFSRDGGLRMVSFSLATLLLVGCQPPPTEEGLPVTRATTFFTEPLRADGALDYPAAMNTEYALPAASNAAVPLSAVFRYELAAETLRLMGRDTVADAGLPVFVGGDGSWDDYRAWRRDASLPPLADAAALGAQLTKATRPWQAADLPALHAWSTDMGPALTAIDRASRLEGHWIPASDPLYDTPTPPLQAISAASDALRARAMYRLGEADPTAALSDLRAMLRLSALVADRGKLLSALVAISARVTALEALPQVAVHPDLTVSDLAGAQAELGIDEFTNRFITALNTERVSRVLPMIGTAALTGRLERPGLSPVEITDRVKGTEIATDYNRHFDRIIDAVRAQTDEERVASEQEAQRILDTLGGEPTGGLASRILLMLSGRSSATEQVIRIMIGVWTPGILWASWAAEEIRAMSQVSALYLDLMISRQRSGFYPASLDRDRQVWTYRTIYAPTGEPRATGFALVAKPNGDDRSLRSFCLDATGGFVVAAGADSVLAAEGRCQTRSD